MKVILVSGLETQGQAKGVFSMQTETNLSGNASRAAELFALKFFDDAERYPHVIISPDVTNFSFFSGTVARFPAVRRNYPLAFKTSGLVSQDFGALNGLPLSDSRLKQDLLDERFKPEGGEAGSKAAARQERAVLRGLAFAAMKNKETVWVLCPADAFSRLSTLAGGQATPVTEVAPMSVFEAGDGAKFARKLVESQLSRVTSSAKKLLKPAISQSSASFR